MLCLAVYTAVVLSFQFLTNVVLKLFINRFEVKLKSSTNAEIYRKAAAIDIVNYNNSEFYNKLHRAIKESDSRYFLVLMQLFSFFVSTLTFVSIFAIYRDPIVLLATVISVLNYIIYHFWANKKGYDFDKKEEPYARLQDYMDRVFYSKEYAEELRMTEGIRKRLLEKLENETEGHVERYHVYLKAFSYRSILMTTIGYLIFWIVSVYVSARMLGRKITVGEFSLVLSNFAMLASQTEKTLCFSRRFGIMRNT